jgi:hypothetical protein
MTNSSCGVAATWVGTAQFVICHLPFVIKRA